MSSKRLNIWLVSFFENTPIDDNQNTRFNSIAHKAINSGHRISFWSSTFRHNTKTQRFSSTTRKPWQRDSELIFIETKPYRNNISLARLYSHYILSKNLLKSFNREEKKADIIYMAFPPISTAKAVSAWAKRNNIPFILDIIDPWPDAFGSHSFKLKWVFKILLFFLRKNTRDAFKNSSGITSISNQYLQWSDQYIKEIPKECFYPAIDLDVVKARLNLLENEENDQFIVVYAGSLGFSYDIPTILDSAADLEKKYQDQIQFVIAGDGPQRKLVEKYEKEHRNLTYLGRIPKDKLIGLYKKAKLGLTQHTQGATQSVTYKLFDLLSCGLPVLNSLESEMKSIIIDNAVGLHNDPGDSHQLASNIEYYFNNPREYDLASKNAARLTEEKGDSKVVYKELLKFIENISVE